MTRLTNLTPAEKKFIDDAIAAAERAAGKKLNQPNRGSKRESQKIPSFRMMKIQSTPRLT
ncbi:TPA: hypothetical protein R4Y07_004786 [Escherichia coli]|nr:hypothetical protein LAKAOGFJ_00005 [Escherichia coli]HED2291088.1 hypothetical protein [Escherichia coli]HED2291194.1 hypothetical protein [Escherichia coli]